MHTHTCTSTDTTTRTISARRLCIPLGSGVIYVAVFSSEPSPSSPFLFPRSVVANFVLSGPLHGRQRLAMLALHMLHLAFRRLCVQLPRCTAVTTTRALTLYRWEPFRKIIAVRFCPQSSAQCGERQICIRVRSLSTFVKGATETPHLWKASSGCQLFLFCLVCLNLSLHGECSVISCG